MKLKAVVRLLCLCAALCVGGSQHVLAQTDAPTPTPDFEPGTVAPATSAPEPQTTAPTPTTTAPEPTTIAPTPTTTAPVPTTTAPEPTTAAPVPTTAAPEPTTAAPVPTTTAPVPTTMAPTPTTTAPTPTTTAPTPTTPAPTTPTPTTPAPTTLAPIYFTPTTTVNGTLVCGPRVRRSWATLNPADKQLYQDAVNASMVLGYHALFLEVHSQFESAGESHRTCGFLYWHRRFLYAYETMLRSLEPRFACLTVPYWDYYADFAKRLSSGCTTLEGCSTFLQDMGGSAGTPGSNTINGIAASGICANAPLVSNFCHASSASGASCNRCLPRSDWLAKAFPSGFGYSTLARLLSGSYQYAIFSQNLQYGTHNSIHNTVMGTMGTMATAADPIYYNHHATMDLVAQMFYDCQVGRDMTETEKKTSPYAFQQCILSSADVCPTALSNMTMQVGSHVAGQPFTNVEVHPMLAPFFASLPNQYWQWVSGTDMGNFSYSYEKDTLFSFLQSSGLFCPKNKGRRHLASAARFTSDSDERTRAVTKTFKLFQDVYTDAMYATGYSRDTALEQVELMECQYYKDEFGFVDDFSDEFKKNFGLPMSAKTTCARHMQEMQSGAKRIRVGNWKTTFADHLSV